MSYVEKNAFDESEESRKRGATFSSMELLTL